MRIDVYTKTILTIIAILLGAIAYHSFVQPGVVIASQSQFDGVHFAVSGTKLWAVDTNTNHVLIYDMDSLKLEKVASMSRLGDPLTPVPIPKQ